jgi:hypothetical protein
MTRAVTGAALACDHCGTGTAWWLRRSCTGSDGGTYELEQEFEPAVVDAVGGGATGRSQARKCAQPDAVAGDAR